MLDEFILVINEDEIGIQKVAFTLIFVFQTPIYTLLFSKNLAGVFKGFEL